MKKFVKKIRKKIKKKVFKSKYTRSYAKKYLEIKRTAICKRNSQKIEPDDKTIVFSSFMDASYSCSPRAMYEAIINDPFFDDFKLIWVFKRPNKILNLEIPALNRAIIVKSFSKDYYNAIYKAKYRISNSRFRVHEVKTSKQYFIQTWHGTPFKKLAHDIKVEGSNGAYAKQSMLDIYSNDTIKYDVMPSPSRYYTERLTSAFNLQELNKADVIVELGYPRNDFLFKYQESDVDKVKVFYNLPMDRKVILYTPTWRDHEYDPMKGYTYNIELDFKKLYRDLGHEYVIIFRPHYFITNAFDFSEYEGFVYDGSLTPDINDLYIISDILITDYSSTFFDYANLNRNIIFYMYDYEFYNSVTRGFYLSLDELPGPVVMDQEDLTKVILDNNQSKVKLDIFNKRFNYLEDGNSAARLVDYVFKSSY